MSFSKISYYSCVKTFRTGGGCRSMLTAVFLSMLSLYSSSLVTAAGQQDSRDELLSRWSTVATERQDLRDERQSRLSDTHGRGTSTAAAAETLCASNQDRTRPAAALAHNGRLDGTPCPTIEGRWLSTKWTDSEFEIRATGLVGRLDVCDAGSDFSGGAQLFVGNWGHVTVTLSKPATDAMVIFVGHCRASHGMDIMTGEWVIALPEKNILDAHHLVITSIPDTLVHTYCKSNCQ